MGNVGGYDREQMIEQACDALAGSGYDPGERYPSREEMSEALSVAVRVLAAAVAGLVTSEELHASRAIWTLAANTRPEPAHGWPVGGGVTRRSRRHPS